MEKDRNLLNRLLTQSGPGGQNILVTASKKAAAQDRWFTAKDSQDVVDVYKYFAIYQLRLANLLTELWNTQSCNNTPVPPDCLSTTTIQQYLDKFQTDIDAQAKLLKPPLPPGTFIDRNTMRMWPTASWPLNGQDALNWTSYWQPRRCTYGGLGNLRGPATARPQATTPSRAGRTCRSRRSAPGPTGKRPPRTTSRA